MSQCKVKVMSSHASLWCNYLVSSFVAKGYAKVQFGSRNGHFCDAALSKQGSFQCSLGENAGP